MKLLDNMFINILLLSIVAVIVGILLSSYKPEKPNLGFPWQIEQTADGSIKVFQIHLGETTLNDAENMFKETAEITLFAPRDGSPVIEAYFNDLSIGGLKAKLVITLGLDQDVINSIYERGERISTLGSGTRKVTLNDTDLMTVRASHITTLTYLPSINLDAELIQKRFGEPQQKIVDGESQHWLYPEKGLDIVLNQNSKEVLQYTLPKEFDKIAQPLIK